MQTKDFGRLFFHFAKFTGEDKPVTGRIPTQEIEYPYRHSNSVMLRVPPTPYGLVVGWWRKTGYDEETALMTAMDGYGLDLYDEDLDDPDTRQAIRDHIARSTNDLNDEWTISSMILGDDPVPA